MPTLEQVNAGTVPFTQDQADDLIPALRSSLLYSRNRALYPEVSTLVNPIVGTSTRTAMLLSAIHAVVFEEGFADIALKGGKEAVELSTTMDRERELALALDALIDRPIGATLYGTSSAPYSGPLTNVPVW